MTRAVAPFAPKALHPCKSRAHLRLSPGTIWAYGIEPIGAWAPRAICAESAFVAFGLRALGQFAFRSLDLFRLRAQIRFGRYALKAFELKSLGPLGPGALEQIRPRALRPCGLSVLGPLRPRALHPLGLQAPLAHPHSTLRPVQYVFPSSDVPLRVAYAQSPPSTVQREVLIKKLKEHCSP